MALYDDWSVGDRARILRTADHGGLRAFPAKTPVVGNRVVLLSNVREEGSFRPNGEAAHVVVRMTTPGERGFLGKTVDGYSIGLTFPSGDVQVYAFGNNAFGQLGDGTTTYRPTPVLIAQGEIPAGAVPSAIACSREVGFMLSTAGLLYAWGRNNQGEFGNGTTLQSLTPKEAAGAHPFDTYDSVTCGLWHVLAGQGTTPRGWGHNSYGQVGDGTTISPRTFPRQIVGGSGLLGFRAGRHHSLAYKGGSTVWAWGRNQLGQFGDGTFNPSSVPIAAGSLGSTVIAVEGGNQNSSWGIETLGQLGWSWGENAQGQLGNGLIATSQNVPGLISGGHRFVSIDGGMQFGVGIVGTDAYAWGSNTYGQLGDGTTGQRLVPTLVLGGHMWADVVATDYSCVGLTTAGGIYHWGRKFDYSGNNLTPTVVPSPSSYSAIAGNGSFVLLLTSG